MYLIQERKKPSALSADGESGVPVLLSWRLQDLRDNMAGPPVRIHDYQVIRNPMLDTRLSFVCWSVCMYQEIIYLYVLGIILY